MSGDIEALLREREGYLRRGRADRVAQVDAVLATVGLAVADEPLADPEPPAIETADADLDGVETATVVKGGKKR